MYLAFDKTNSIRYDAVTVKNEPMIQTIYGDVMIVGFAGGLAGQMQTSASHYTELWSETMRKQKGETLKCILKKYPYPSIRSIVLSFPASAIGFIAFE